MSTLRVSFAAKNVNPKEVSGQIVKFLRRLEAAEVKADLLLDLPVVDVRVSSPAEAIATANALLGVGVDWETLGPLCPTHGTTVIMVRGGFAKHWKCLEYGCGVEFQTTAEIPESDFLTMSDLLAKKREVAGTVSGRTPANAPQANSPRSDPPPMPHVLPDAVLAMALSLRAVGGPNTVTIGMPTHDEFVYEVEEGSEAHIEMAKAAMLGEVSKHATVLDVRLQAKASKAQERIGYVRTLQGRRQDITPEETEKVARALVDAFQTAYPEIAKHLDYLRHNSKVRNFSLLYGGRDPMLKELNELVKKLEQAAAQRENDIADLTAKNKDLAAVVRMVGDTLTSERRKLAEVQEENQDWKKEVDKLMEAVQATDRLIRTVAGLNLQDHPLSVQREVRDALAAAMRAMKGEDLK